MKLLFALLSSVIMNLTYSPDSTKVAYTVDNDLYVKTVSSGKETRLTMDGSELLLNGYASWVYYEEIFGRSSQYKAFWWSPDSRKIAFFRFDNSGLCEFPIFSPFGQYGSVNSTRYPKAGTANPTVRIGMVDLDRGTDIVWADFDEKEDQYFGTPFWSDDSRNLYVQWEPRRQNELTLYRVDASNGRKTSIYKDSHPTWVDWIEGMLFTRKGLYFVRDSDTGWAQIYFLAYTGKCHRISSGPNWDIQLLRCNERTGELWFMAKRDSRLHPTLYHMTSSGMITALTDPDYWTKGVQFSADGRSFTASISTAKEPWMKVEGSATKSYKTSMKVVGRMKGVNLSDRPMPEIVQISNDGYDLYGLISYPRYFSSFEKYPVVIQVYGGPGTPYVRDYWGSRDATDDWCYRNGVIYMVVDPRSSGENGRKGLDEAFGRMTVVELQDYIAWAKWLQTKPFVKADKIGVEGFSFGGTSTAMLVLRYPQYFCCGIAGGGVYDWTLYDTHYTERFMDTPQKNPDGYKEASVLQYVNAYGVNAKYRPGSLKLTHGTGDDNVHLQNTLQLMDALQQCDAQFDLMLYPDGMHGYRGYQGRHSRRADGLFWRKHLLDSK